MIKRIQRWGNSQGLRVSKDLLAEAGIEVGDPVQVAEHDGTLVITPVRRVRGALDLERLVESIPRGATPGEVEWGAPEGDEVW